LTTQITKNKEHYQMSKEEEILANTSWMQGFLDGRENGFEVGLKLGLTAAIQELERLIEKRKEPNPEIKLADDIKDLEHQLSQLGFVRAESSPPRGNQVSA
jgi:hypothetical protein